MNPLVLRAIAFSLVLVLLGGTFGIMASSNDQQPSTGESILPTFESNEHLVDHLRSRFSMSLKYQAFGAGEDQGSGEHSETNLQVEGVDEMDTVKTDGENLFIVSSQGVHILKAYPAEQLENLSIISAHDLFDLDRVNYSVIIQGIFLGDNELVVVSSVHPWGDYPFSEFLGTQWYTHTEMTVISLFDVTDPSSPARKGFWGMSGFPIAARMIDGCVYTLGQDWIWIQEDVPEIPIILDGSGTSELEGTEVHYDPLGQSADCYVNILSVDVEAEEFEVFSVVTGWTSTVFVSESSIYISALKDDPAIFTFQNGEDRIQIESAVSTTIFKIEVRGTSMIASARGEVAGWLLNQFSMDEYLGYLRVVTTTSWLEPENCVFVLDDQLKIEGALTGIAPSETVYAARFYGEILYLVTFERVDPLFVIDLTNPSDPIALGELKVPGFSTYLHRLDSSNVMGIGLENSSVKVSIYNVTDPHNPTERCSYVFLGEYTYSPALWDHHAVLIDVEMGLMVIPLTYSSGNGSMMQGMAVLNLSPQWNITLRGIVDLGEWIWNARSVYIGDCLYSISPTKVVVSDLADLSEVNVFVYLPQSGYWETTPEADPVGAGE